MSLAEEARGAVEIFVADAAGHIRSNLCGALRQQGFSLVREYSRLSELRADVATVYVDALVVDVQLPGGDVCDFLEEVRRRDISANPFAAIVATTWDSRTEVVRRVVESGVDDILVKPISVAKLIHRIEAIAADRKPFVVTSSYIGPDRRAASRPDTDARLIDVPNTLNAKAQGQSADAARLREVIDHARSQLNTQKLRQNALEIARLVRQILPVLGADAIADATRRPLSEIYTLAKDTAERLRGTPYEGVGDMCGALVNVIASLRETAGAPNPKDVELLDPLSKGLLMAVASEGGGRDKTGEIAASVESFTQARKQNAPVLTTRPARASR